MLQLLQEDKMVHASEIKQNSMKPYPVYFMHLALILELFMPVK